MSDRRSVMISSTARDLPEHREHLRKACERASLAPHEMMEHLTAEDATPVEASLRMVAAADVYLCILAHRYGHVPAGQEKSVTEMEYDEAVRLKKPRLVFFMHDDHPITARDVETGPGAARLAAFKARIGAERVAAFFTSAEDLRAHAVEALTVLSRDLDAQTPLEVAQARLHRRTVIPPAPALYAHPTYTLLPPTGLVGRREELSALSDWVSAPGSALYRLPLFCLVAIGGMGKSALAWDWMTRIAPEEMRPLAGRLWWSFYESDAGFENFLTRALAYVAGMTEEDAAAMPWPARQDALLRHLDEAPFLLVLDGFERVLRAYSGMDASYLADDDLDERTANGVARAWNLPDTAATSFVGKHWLRQANDPRIDVFLRRLAMVRRSRVLITTRLFPAGVQVPTGEPWAGCAAYFLRGLGDDDAVALWRDLGVSGAREELLPVFRSVEAHPLLVRALAAEVAEYRPAPGDFTRWRADHPAFDPTTLPLVQSRTHILEFALEGLSEAERAVLITIVGFRMPTGYDTLAALSMGEGLPCADPRALDAVLTALEDRGLIGWDRAENRYDAHPIVRGVVWNGASAEDRTGVMTALADHFEPMEVPDRFKVETLAELTPAIERYHSLIGLGRYEDAFTLFYDRLSRAMLYRLAAHRRRIEMLEGLFPEGVEAGPALARPRDRGFTLNALALSYDSSGRCGCAADLYRQAEAIDVAEGDDGNRAITLSNLGQALFETGGFRTASWSLLTALAINREQEYAFWEAVQLQELGRVFAATGAVDDAVLALRRSALMFDKENAPQSEGITAAYRAERALWQGDAPAARDHAARAATLAQHRRHARDLIRADLLRGRAALAGGDLAGAEGALHGALTEARARDLVELELPALVALAQWHRARGDAASARERLSELWAAAEAGPYPRHTADALNTLAAIERDAGNAPAAIEAATRAYHAAWCDGPPYAYHWALRDARAHLAALNAPEPAMPPFDEAAHDPLPDIEINPRDKHWVDPAAPDPD